MNLRALTVGGFGITIFLAVLTEGMIVTRADVAYLFSKPVRLVRTILAMNVLGPIVAVIVCRLFALHPAVIVALVTLSMTPVGALFPQGMLALVRAGGSPHDQNHSTRLMKAAAGRDARDRTGCVCDSR